MKFQEQNLAPLDIPQNMMIFSKQGTVEYRRHTSFRGHLTGCSSLPPRFIRQSAESPGARRPEGTLLSKENLYEGQDGPTSRPRVRHLREQEAQATARLKFG